MKRSLLSLLLFLLCCVTAFAATKEAKVNYEFKAGTVKALTIVNKNGKIEIDRVVGRRNIVVDVWVRCNAKTEADALKMLNGISIDKQMSGDVAAVNTVLLNNKSLKELFTGADYSVNYRITVPWGVELNLVNENGAISVPNYSDRLTVQAQNCNVYVGDVTSETPCTLIVKRGNCVLKGAEYLEADFDNCSYNIGRVLSSSIKARGAEGKIDFATVAKVNLIGGSLLVTKVEDISGTAVDTDITISDLGDCLNMETTRRSLNVQSVHYSFGKINVTSLWTDVNFTFMKDAGFDLTLQHDKRLKVNLPAGFKLGRLSSSKKKAIMGAGYYGNPNRKSDVRLRMNAGTLTIK